MSVLSETWLANAVLQDAVLDQIESPYSSDWQSHHTKSVRAAIEAVGIQKVCEPFHSGRTKYGYDIDATLGLFREDSGRSTSGHEKTLSGKRRLSDLSGDHLASDSKPLSSCSDKIMKIPDKRVA